MFLGGGVTCIAKLKCQPVSEALIPVYCHLHNYGEVQVKWKILRVTALRADGIKQHTEQIIQESVKKSTVQKYGISAKTISMQLHGWAGGILLLR